MKILYSLPKMSDLLKHDSRLMHVVKLCLPAFVLISSITVFAGVKIQLAEYLEGTNLIIKTGALGLVYLLSSLAPDIVNVVCVTYITRSFLTNRYKNKTDAILIGFCFLLSIGLTRYSYQMSQFSARNVASEASPEIELSNISEIDRDYFAQKKVIHQNYEQEYNRINSNYEQLLKNTKDVLDNQLTPFRNQIKNLEKNRKPTNTLWTDKQINKLSKRISKLQIENSDKERNLLNSRQKALDELRIKKTNSERNIDQQNESNRTAILSLDKTKQDHALKIQEVFTREFSWIAGKAIFIVIILATILEIIYVRNKVDPIPVFSQFDFQASFFKEIFSLPFVYMGRHLINQVRSVYANLPELKEPPRYSKLYDWSNYQQEIDSVVEEINTKDENNSNIGEKPSLNDDKKHTENGVYENRIYDQKEPATEVIQKELYKECLHCQKSYIPNHKKQKYCSEECRKAAWEKRTGRALKLKAKKKG